MTNQTQITAATDEHIPFADLYLSDINPRTIVNDDAIVALAANIQEHMLTNLQSFASGAMHRSWTC